MSLLGLVEETVTRTSWVGWLRQRSVEELVTVVGWTVDGKPLRTWIAGLSDGQVSLPREEISNLAEDSPHEAVEQLRQLLGLVPAELPHGRVALLVCPVCGDLECGALSAELAMTEATVSWVQIGWQTGRPGGFTPFQPDLDIVFERTQYEDTLTVELRRFRLLADS